jgi:NAD(P)-dependent dehydrogenase (short-subunit alcohol dehydrogenase family)
MIAEGKVAVVTGAASGIGKAACISLAGRGMSVCLVDLPGPRLDSAAAEVNSAARMGSGGVAKISADVSVPDQIEALHREVIARFGKVHFLMNNAVTRAGRGHSAYLADWRHAMEVNFWGVVTAVRAFLPDMLAIGEPGVIVNVGSKQGIANPPGHPIYNITKSAIKTYTEALEHDLRSTPDNTGSNRVSAHLLIPGWTTTGDAAHRPGAWLPGQVVGFMIEGLANGDFYILCPDDDVTTEMDHKRIIWAAQDITQNRPPLSRWHPGFEERAKNECS